METEKSIQLSLSQKNTIADMVSKVPAGDVFDEISRTVPNSVEKIMDAQPVVVLLRTKRISREKIQEFLEAEIVGLAGKMNVANNLQPWQKGPLAEMLLENYPSESLEDFVLVFRRGAAGYYGSDFHRLDAATIGGWMTKHMDEKAFYLERFVQEEKKSDQDSVVNYQKFKERLELKRAEEREKQIEQFVKKSAEQEQLEKVRSQYRPTSLIDSLRSNLHTNWIRENFDPQTKAPLDGYLPEYEWTLALIEEDAGKTLTDEQAEQILKPLIPKQ